MATQGTFTAYQRLKPLEGDVSQDIQQQEENGFKRRAEKRVEGQIAQQKIDREDQKKKELWDKYVKPISNYDTGSKSLNEVQGKLLIQAQKEYVPLMNVINNPKSSDEDRLKATLKLENINKLPENMLAMTKNLTQRDLAIKKGVADGTMFANPEYDKNYQEGFSNKILALDENGMPMIAFNNPDGSRDLETYDQIQNVMKKYDFNQRFDRNAELLAASKNLQPIANDKDLLKDYVTNQLYELDGVTPTARLKSFARDAGITDLANTTALKKIADNYSKDLLLRVKPDTTQQALEQKIKQDALDQEYRNKKFDYDVKNDATNREAAKENLKTRLDANAAGTTVTTKETDDDDVSTTKVTVKKGNKGSSPKSTTNKKKAYAGIDPKTGKAIYK